MTAPGRSGLLRAGRVVLVSTGSATAVGWLLGATVSRLARDPKAPWVLGRAAGVTSYLLLVALVLMGLLLAHPWRALVSWISPAARLRLHVSLAAFTAVFTTLHVVALATDRYAGVGWTGVLIPQAAAYRPLAVTLGVIGLWSGLLAGVTAALAGRIAARIWWPIHKVAVLSLVLVWGHGVLAGTDVIALEAVYVLTGILVLIVAVSRYTAQTPRDRLERLTRDLVGVRS